MRLATLSEHLGADNLSQPKEYECALQAKIKRNMRWPAPRVKKSSAKVT